jgi:hypothetical protein
MPLQQYNGYYVDYRCRQFRTVTTPPCLDSDDFPLIDFIDFRSDRGDALLCEMLSKGLVPEDKIHYLA